MNRAVQDLITARGGVGPLPPDDVSASSGNHSSYYEGWDRSALLDELVRRYAVLGPDKVEYGWLVIA